MFMNKKTIYQIKVAGEVDLYGTATISKGLGIRLKTISKKYLVFVKNPLLQLAPELVELLDSLR